MTDIINVSQIRIIFPVNFPETRFANREEILTASQILREGDSLEIMADDTMLDRVANHFDFNTDSMRSMQVSRPSEGRILISAKFSYG